MPRRLPSFSKLDLADLCIGSAVLPRAELRSEAANKGKAKHRYLEDVVAFGREAALARVPPEERAACALIDLSKLPALDSVASEVGLAFDVKTGVARELRLANARDYGDVGPDEHHGTTDVLGHIGDDGVFVNDYKSGHSSVRPPAENLQLLGAAVAACRASGRSRAVVAITRIRDDGDSSFESAELDAFAIDEAEAKLVFLAEKVGWAARDLAKGKVPRLSVGGHCRFCPALLACPAQAGMVKRMAGQPEAVAQDVKVLLTPETAARAVQNAKAFAEALRVVWAAIYAYAKDNPIPLPDGQVFGPVETKRESLDGDVVHAVLAEMYGEPLAREAVAFEATQKSVKDALAVIAVGEGKPLAPMWREVQEAVRARGGVRVTVSESIKEHRPPPPMQLTPPSPVVAELSADVPAPRRLAIVDVAPGESEEAALARAGQ